MGNTEAPFDLVEQFVDAIADLEPSLLSKRATAEAPGLAGPQPTSRPDPAPMPEELKLGAAPGT